MYKQVLQKNRVMLVENGEFGVFRDHLIQEELLTYLEVETIEAENTRHKRISKFLDTLYRKPDGVVRKCFAAIQQADIVLYDQIEWSRGPSPALDVSDGLDIPPGGDEHPQDDLWLIQAELEDWYLHTLSRLHPIPWCEWLELDLDHVFTNLLVMPGRKTRYSAIGDPVSLKGDSDQTDVKITAGDESSLLGLILEADDLKHIKQNIRASNNRTVTFVEGPAGIGKSTLCRRLVYLWATNDHYIHGRHFDLVFILEARTLVGDIKSSISQQLFSEDFALDANSIYDCIKKNDQKSLLIVDGVDELGAEGKKTILKLLKGTFLRHAHLLLTGRPESAREFIKYANVHLALKGFTYENVESYICKYFHPAQRQCRDKLLNRLRNDFQLQKLVVNPFTTLLLCLLTQDSDGDIPTNFNDILQQVIESTCNHYVNKVNAEKEVTKDQLFQAAGKVAYSGFKNGKVVFLEREVTTVSANGLGEHLLKSGLLNRDFTLSRLHATGYCYFPHKSIQEYLCARHLADLSETGLHSHMVPLTLKYGLDINMYRLLLNLLADKESKFRIVLNSLCSKIERARPESFTTTVESLRWSLLLLANIETNINVLDLTAEVVSRSDRLNRAFCYGSFYKYWAGRLDVCARLILQKMALRPVVVAVHDRRLARGLGECCGRDVSHFSKKDKELDVTTAVQFVHVRELLVSSKGIDCLLELSWPCVHCKSVTAATEILTKGLSIQLLTITLLPGAHTFHQLAGLVAALSAVKVHLTLVIFILDHLHDDYTNFRMLSLLSSGQTDIVRIRFCSSKPYNSIVSPIDQPSSTASKSCYELEVLYRFRKSVHQMCYEKFCPF